MAIKFLDEEEQPSVSKIKFLDEEEPVVVPPTRPTPQQIERQQGAALTPPEGFVPNRSVMPAYEGEGGAAFGVYRVQGKARQENVKARKAAEPKKLSVEDVAADEELFNKAQAYMKASGGDAFKKGEDRAEYVNKFLDHRTFIESSLTFGAAPELSRLVGGDDKVKKSIAEGRDLYENMADREGLRPAVAVTKGIASDIPLMAVTAGAGKVTGGATAKFLSKQATEEVMKRSGVAGVAVGEAMLGGAGDVTQQRIEQQTAKVFGEEPAELDPIRTGAVMLLSGSLGYAFGGGKVDPAKAYQQGKALEKALAKKNIVPETPTSPFTDAEKALFDPVRDQMDVISDMYKKETGRLFIDGIDPAGVITDAKVKNDMSKMAIRIALKVVEVDPTFQRKPNEKISSFLSNAFASINKLDAVSLERVLNTEDRLGFEMVKDAMVKAGVDEKQFSYMTLTTSSDAGRTLAQYSVAQRGLLKTLQKNPELEARLKNLYDIEDVGVGFLAKANEAQQRLAREWKAWITSGVDTTSRNVLSTAGVIGLDAAVKLMEGTMFSIGTALSSASKGQRGSVLYKGMGDTVKDSLGTLFYMWKGGLASDITEKLLADTPALRSQVIQSLQETGNREISQLGQWANSFNVTIDAFIRRAVFSASIHQQLRRQGVDLYADVLGKNASVPTDMLRQATKDALQTTFSYLPKKADEKLISSSIERGAASMASNVIGIIDKTPFLNFAIPFPRYMANAMAFAYRYSPVGSLSAGQDLLFNVPRLIKEGKQQQAELVYRQASEKLIKSAMGTAALASAYEFRKDNKELPWYEIPATNGTSVDTRPLGPPAAYLAWGETFARIEDGTYSGDNVKAAFEASTGLKFKAGSQDTFIDQMIQAYESEDKMRSFLAEGGKFVGNIAGGFTQPFVTKQIVDFINLIREEGRVARDVRPIESETTAGQVGQTFLNQIINKIPVLKETLPEAVMPMKSEDISREGEFFGRILGFRPTIQRTPEEQEIFRLNLNPYTLYGGSSGDRAYDRRFIETANESVREAINIALNDPMYQSLPDVEKNIALTAAVRERTKEARELTRAFFEDTDMRRIYRERYRKLPAVQRRAINRRYAEDNNGKSIEETGDYFAIDEYETELRGRTGLAKGGLVTLQQQTEHMLGR